MYKLSVKTMKVLLEPIHSPYYSHETLPPSNRFALHSITGLDVHNTLSEGERKLKCDFIIQKRKEIVQLK